MAHNKITVKTVKPTGTIMGYKGASYLDAGYYYAPYSPLTSTPHTYMISIAGAPTHHEVERRAHDLWRADVNKVEERTDMRDSETDTRPPDHFVRHPEYYWNKAIKELVSPIAQAIADEAGDGIIFKPGKQSSFPFEYWRCQNDRCFAKASIEGEAFIILGNGTADVPYCISRFNLHLEKDIEALIEYLKDLQKASNSPPTEKNPCNEIPLDPDEWQHRLNKGILTSKKLIDKSLYNKIIIHK